MKTKKPRVCLIYTGGTIGMVRGEDGTLRPPDDPKVFLDVAPELAELVELTFEPLMNKDSTNMNPRDWTKMAKAVYERRGEGYSGFVIAHGTDTMHFSAAAVAFALGDRLRFPVVFTGAQTIPDVKHGDARVNLVRACKVACTDIAEVVICFGEYVFRGCRAQKKDERRFDAFESPAIFPIAYITEEILIGRAILRGSREAGDIDLKADFASGVIQISLIPGLEPDLLEPIIREERCNGIILQSFGAGNVPDEEEFSFAKVIGLAHRLHKPIIITSQFPANATLHSAYRPSKIAVEAGAIPTGNMTSSCAAAKFRWVLAQVENRIQSGEIGVADRIDTVKREMKRVVVQEMDIPGGWDPGGGFSEAGPARPS